MKNTNIDKISEFRFALARSNGYVTIEESFCGLMRIKYLDQITCSLIAIETRFNDGSPTEYCVIKRD